MFRLCKVAFLLMLMLSWSLVSFAQQKYLLPDVRSLKHLTTGKSEHAADLPGKETTMDFYSAPNGQVITVYSYKGKSVAFSTHSNSDVQNTYRIFLDRTGEGTFQEIQKSLPWELPAWAR